MMAISGVGLIGIVLLFALLVAGMPVGVALGLVGLAGLAVLLGPEPALIKAGVVTFDTLSRYDLGTLPLFLLMAHLAFSANASRDLFTAASRLVGHRRGGLALSSVGGCAAFGAVSGSSLATAATIGLVALPEMRRHGYHDSLAAGSVAAGGTLGQLIPPSGALIVYGIVAEQSIGRLFTAAIIPGLTQMLLYFAVIWILVRLNPALAPPTERAPWNERFRALSRVIDLLLLILFVISGIAFGWFSPTEAASMGAAGVLLICLFRGKLTRKSLREALSETLKTSGMIYTVVVGALIFSVFISVSGIADAVATFISSLTVGTTLTVFVMALFLLLLGSVLDGLALMLLTTPIFLPVLSHFALSPIWFGIILVRTMEIGFIHPPMGINLYVIQNVMKDISIGTIFRSVLPFLAADFLHLALLILFPVVVLWLPKVLGS